MRGKGLATTKDRLEPRLAGVLCYLLWIISGLLLLTFERESRFVRFHALQSMLYTAVVVVVLATTYLVGLHVVSGVLSFVAVTVWLYLMYRAARGQWFQLPVVGWWAERNA